MPDPLPAISVDITVSATLVLVLQDGTTIPATAEHLARLGFVHARSVERALADAVEQIAGYDPNGDHCDGATLVSYLASTAIYGATSYGATGAAIVEHVGGGDPEAIDVLRQAFHVSRAREETPDA